MRIRKRRVEMMFSERDAYNIPPHTEELRSRHDRCKHVGTYLISHAILPRRVPSFLLSSTILRNSLSNSTVLSSIIPSSSVALLFMLLLPPPVEFPTDRLVAAVVLEIASLLAAATPLLFFVNDGWSPVGVLVTTVVVVTPRLRIVTVARIPLKESSDISTEMNDNAKMTHIVK